MSFMDVTGGGPMSIGYNNMLAQNQVNQFNQSMANSAGQNYAAIAAANSYDPWASGGGFGKQTADYSALGAAYGRQVAPSSPAAVAAAHGGGGYPAGQVTSQPIPDIPWQDPFGSSKGGGKGLDPGLAPNSADFDSYADWSRANDAYLGGNWPPAQPATSFNDTYFQRAGGNPFNAPRQPEKWDGLGQQDWFTAATSNAAPPPQQPAYPMSSGGGSPDYGRVQPDPFGNMWGGKSSYAPGVGSFDPGYAPNSADYQTYADWERANNAFMNGMNAYNKGGGYVPTPEPRPASAPGNPLQTYDPGTSFGTQGGDNSRLNRYGGELELADITRSSDLGRNAIAEQVMRNGKGNQMLPSAVFGGYPAENMWRDPFANSQPSTGYLGRGGIYQDPFGGYTQPGNFSPDMYTGTKDFTQFPSFDPGFNNAGG